MIVYDGFFKVERNGNREVVRMTDSVAFLIADFEHGLVVLIEQSRAPMVRPDNPLGNIIEVPAGRFDCPLSVRGLIVKEGDEEIGIIFTEDDVRLLNKGKPLASSPGVSTERVYLGYIEWNLEPYLSGFNKFGAPDEDEDITRYILDVETLRMMTFDDLKTMTRGPTFFRHDVKRQGGKA